MYNSMPRDLVEVRYWLWEKGEFIFAALFLSPGSICKSWKAGRSAWSFPQICRAFWGARGATAAKASIWIFQIYLTFKCTSYCFILSQICYNKYYIELIFLFKFFKSKSRSSCFILSEIFSSSGTFPGLHIYNLRLWNLILTESWAEGGSFSVVHWCPIQFLSSLYISLFLIKSVINAKTQGDALPGKNGSTGEL